jgi:hypothetical protein
MPASMQNRPSHQNEALRGRRSCSTSIERPVLTKASRPTAMVLQARHRPLVLSVVEPSCSGCLPFAACEHHSGQRGGRALALPHAVIHTYGRNCTRSTSAVIDRAQARNGLLIVVVIARPQVKLERRSGCVQHCAAPSAAAVLPHGRLQQPKRCGPGALTQGSVPRPAWRLCWRSHHAARGLERARSRKRSRKRCVDTVPWGV